MTDIILYALFGAAVIVVIYRLTRLLALRGEAGRQLTPAPEQKTSRRLNADEIASRHAADEHLHVTLTAAPASTLGKRELLRLRPGDPLWLEHSDFSGIERVKVFSGRFMIGELLLTEAECVIRIMECSDITGTYVARQNTSDLRHIDLQIVIYHTTPRRDGVGDKASRRAVDRALTSPYILTVSSLDNPRLFQN